MSYLFQPGRAYNAPETRGVTLPDQGSGQMRDSFGDRLTRSSQAKMCALEVAGHSPLSQDIFTRG
jgi:hypothetical protein